MTEPLIPSLPILMVDDEAQALKGFEIALRTGGMNNLLPCRESDRVLALMAGREVEVLLLDLWMPGVSGLEILSEVAQKHPEVPVIVITGLNEVDTAVQCMKTGAFDYLVKPVEKERLVTAVRRAIELRELRRENVQLRSSLLGGALRNPEAFSSIVAASDAMMAIFRYVEAIAATSQPVLITGETGVGKELIARAIHALSGRRGDFVVVNAAGLDDSMFADTLFGHRKGAFTGAEEPRGGIIEKAAGGTLFLDEIGDLSPASQVKLLRLLQEREYLPLGSDIARRTDARMIVATNRDLGRMQEEGSFRRDLYYRLRTHHVHVPALRERREDLAPLLDALLAQASKELGRRKPDWPCELLTLLGTYDFPGNVRELRAMVFDAVSRHGEGTLSMRTFAEAMGRPARAGKRQAPSAPSTGEPSVVFAEKLPTLKQVERMLVDEAMKRSAGNQSMAARLLGITRQALSRRLK